MNIINIINKPIFIKAIYSNYFAGRTALHWAASVNNYRAAQLLLDKGANKDAQDAHEETPLFVACREGSYETAQVLLSHKASTDLADHMDRLPRDIAAERLHDRLVTLIDDTKKVMDEENSTHLSNNLARPLNGDCGSNPLPASNSRVSLKIFFTSIC